MALATNATSVPQNDPKPLAYTYGICLDTQRFGYISPDICKNCKQENLDRFNADLRAWQQRENLRITHKRIAELEAQNRALLSVSYRADLFKANDRIRELETSLKKLQPFLNAKPSTLYQPVAGQPLIYIYEPHDDGAPPRCIITGRQLDTLLEGSPRAQSLQKEIEELKQQIERAVKAVEATAQAALNQ